MIGRVCRRDDGSGFVQSLEPPIPFHERLQHVRNQRHSIHRLAVGLRMQCRIAVKRSAFRRTEHAKVSLTVSVLGSGPSRSLFVFIVMPP